MDLKSVTVLSISPITTVNLQLMGASIIELVQVRYENCQLEHNLYVEEQGLQTNMYMLDHLTGN